MDAGTKSIESFIAMKSAQYFNATRRGAARDSSTGFSLKKTRAALYALKGKACPVKEQARQLGVPYGVLRKWRTEPKFKELVEQLKNEFYARRFIDRPARTSTDALINQFKDILERNKHQERRHDLEKDWHVLAFDIQKRLSRHPLNNNQRLGYMMLCLDLSIAVLKDRKAAIKYRQDLVALLQRLKD